LRLSETGKVANLPETLLLWRLHKASINQTRNHLWMSMKRLALDNTIRRVGTTKFTEDFFHSPETPSDVGRPMILAKLAEERGRGRSAARLYMRAFRSKDDRLPATKSLMHLFFRALRFAVGITW
jgi:hypothetical protein